MNGISDTEFVDGAYIQEGVVPALGVLIVASTIGEDYDKPKSRVGLRRGGLWLDFGLSGESVLSVDADKTGMAYVLGENGTVVRFDWARSSTKDQLRGSRSLFANAAVQPQGPMRRIRVLGSDVVCAGSVGQVYRLGVSSFVALPKLEIGGSALTIEDIAGPGADDMVAVTSDGYAAHFDGRVWTTLDLPTNSSLTSICRLDTKSYAIVGKAGTVLLGSAKSWRLIEPLTNDRNYWGVAAFSDQLYVAHLGGVDRVAAGQLSEVAMPEDTTLQFTVLRSSDDGVWSFADRTIGRIRDNAWTTLIS